MNHKLIKVAIAYPHSYPWRREKLSIDDYKLDELLKTYNLDTEIKRRIAGWKIKFSILKEAILINSYQELLEKVLNTFKNESYCSEAIVNLYIRRLKLEENENVVLFKKFINNETEPKEIQNKIDLFIIWLTEVFAYYNCSNFEITSLDLQNKITNYLNKLFNNTDDYNDIVKNQIYKNGLIKNDVVKLYSESIYEYKNEINTVFSGFINKKPYTERLDNKEMLVNSNDEIEGDISDSILSLFNNSTTLKLNEEEVNEINEKNEANNKVEEVVEKNDTIVEKELIREEINNNNTNENSRIFDDLKSLANTLGYQIANDEEIVISKDKYGKLVDADKDKEITLLKELAILKNGAILSELYNAYKNINEISKENLEAILTNFFFTLSVNGFEVIDDVNNVGDVIRVDTSKVLKEFVFTEAINKEGQVNAKIEYLGWKYKGRQVVPMSVKALD